MKGILVILNSSSILPITPSSARSLHSFPSAPREPSPWWKKPDEGRRRPPTSPTIPMRSLPSSRSTSSDPKFSPLPPIAGSPPWIGSRSLAAPHGSHTVHLPCSLSPTSLILYTSTRLLLARFCSRSSSHLLRMAGMSLRT